MFSWDGLFDFSEDTQQQRDNEPSDLGAQDVNSQRCKSRPIIDLAPTSDGL
ncbi:hypothetical protein L9F63_013298, partial [Diploptera punctata]